MGKKILINFLVIAFAVPSACAQSPHKPINVKVLIDSIDRALFKTYIFPEESKLMGNYLKQQLKKGSYNGIKDNRQLAARIESDIQSVHHDGHLRVNYDPEFANTPPQKQAPYPQGIDSAAVQREKADNFGFKKAEILNGNIGYIQFASFSGMIDEARPIITSAFRFVSNSQALIIDVRRNGGGSPWMVKQISSYFYPEPTRLNDIYDRRADKTMEFWTDPVAADNMKLSMPVYVLTSKHTFSAAEDFTYAMQANKRAIIVGDTTGGGAHPTGPVYVGQDFVIDIPFARSINYITKTDWEGTGVRPDLPTNADDALMEAQKLIFTARLNSAGSDNEKRVAQWYLNALCARPDYDNTFSSDMLDSYEGEYGRFKVYKKNNELYLDDFIGRTFRLQPINERLFLGDDWFQVEFYAEDSKAKMKMSGKPGWVDVMDKK